MLIKSGTMRSISSDNGRWQRMLILQLPNRLGELSYNITLITELFHSITLWTFVLYGLSEIVDSITVSMRCCSYQISQTKMELNHTTDDRDTVVLWCCDAVVLWYCGTVVRWYPGAGVTIWWTTTTGQQTLYVIR